MEDVVLFGVGPDAGQIVVDVWNMIWNSSKIKAVIFNDSLFWGKCLSEGITVQRPADIVDIDFQKVIICGEPEYADAIKSVLITRLGIEEHKVISYHKFLHFNVGEHSLEWNNINTISDLIKGLQDCDTLNELEEYYYNMPHPEMEKYVHYFEIYDRHFRKYRDKECVIVEIGVFNGGSLQMWREYFGNKARIVGIDIEESAAQYAGDRIAIEIGSQSDRGFWKNFREKYPRVDILIDDGGHTMEQQQITFEEMFDHIAEDGVYLCEDMHTSYWGRYGGGFGEKDSFIEYSKNFIDYINAWYSESRELGINKYTRAMHSLHYYDSMLVIEKRKIDRSICIHMGE